MADHQPEAVDNASQSIEHRHMTRRRKVMLGIGFLLALVVVCVATIVTMLQRLEARNATFQPPMTALERQRMLPQDPVLDTTPRLDGLRYREQADGKSDEYPLADDRVEGEHPPQTHVSIIQRPDLHAEAHPGPHPVRASQ